MRRSRSILFNDMVWSIVGWVKDEGAYIEEMGRSRLCGDL